MNNRRGLRLQGGFTEGTATPNIIGGDAANTISSDSVGSVIGGGGGNEENANSITNDAAHATIAGGKGNVASANDTFIGGGANNRASELAATVAGGNTNIASGFRSTVGGGFNNVASNFDATVPGGISNTASGDTAFAAGNRAKAVHDGAFVWADTQSADFTSTASNQFLIRAAGGVGINKNNPAVALDVNGTVRATAFQGMGAPLAFSTTDNQPLTFSVNNQRALRVEFTGANSGANIIGGHEGNSVSGTSVAAVIAGGGQSGELNAIQGNGNFSVIGGGKGNVVSNSIATLAGGDRNTVSGAGATVGGGQFNSATASYSTVPGGTLNTASGATSFAAGNRAKAIHGGSFVWADSQNIDFSSTDMNQFLIRAAGGVNVTGSQTISGSLRVDSAGTNNGALFNDNSLSFGEAASGEGIASKRTLGANQFGLDFYTNYTSRLSIKNSGEVGVGGNPTVNGARFQVFGDALIASSGQLGTGDSRGALTIGSATGSSIGFDLNDIQQWATPTVPGTLFVNQYGGNVRIGSAGATVTVFGTFVNSSDREAKQDIQSVDTAAILSRLRTLPITTWQYKGASERRHIGPMAQDFHAAFDGLLALHSDDKTIAPLDEAGVAFASIQALCEKVETENRKLQDENAALKERLARLERAVEALARPAVVTTTADHTVRR